MVSAANRLIEEYGGIKLHRIANESTAPDRQSHELLYEALWAPPYDVVPHALVTAVNEFVAFSNMTVHEFFEECEAAGHDHPVQHIVVVGGLAESWNREVRKRIGL